MRRSRLVALPLLFLLGCKASPPGGETRAPGSGGSAPGGTGGSAGQGETGGTAGAAAGGAGGSSSTGGALSTGGTPASGGALGMTGGAGQSGGGAGGANPLDAPAPETGADAASACGPGVLFCDDFESYPTGLVGARLGTNWDTDLVGGKIEIDGSKPFAGSRALHISATASSANLLQIKKAGAPLFPLPGNSFHGRMMMWISKVPTGEVHFNTVQANGLLPGSGRIAKYAYGAMYARLMAGYTVRVKETDLPTIDCGKGGPSGYPEQKWTCVEWKFDGANHEMHYWLDGQAQTGVDVVKVGGGCTATGAPPGGVWQAPTFDKLMMGWYSQPFAQPVEVFIDDVAVGIDRVGCPARP